MYYLYIIPVFLFLFPLRPFKASQFSEHSIRPTVFSVPDACGAHHASEQFTVTPQSRVAGM